MDDVDQWMEFMDPATQRPYYANIRTGVTSWEKPDQINLEPKHEDDDDNKVVLYASTSGQFSALNRKIDYKSRIATAVLDEIEHHDNEPLFGAGLTLADSNTIAIADLDLNEADQFHFSDEEDEKPTLSMKDKKLTTGEMAVSGSDRSSRHHSRELSISKNIATGLPGRVHRRQQSEQLDPTPMQEYGSKLRTLDGNSWDGILLSTVSLPSWPKPVNSVCQTEASSYPLSAFVASHFSVSKSWFGSSSSAPDMDTLLRHSTGKLKAPLSKKISAESVEVQALTSQMYKNIQSFMLDRKSGKNWFGHASRILKVGLSSNEDIRNEIYLLILKQLRMNSSAMSLDLGWRLMLICCSIFGPGEELACFLRSFFFQQLLDGIQEPENSIVVACIHSIELTMSRGKRRELPLEGELSAIKDLKLIIARVRLLHGESVQVALHPQSTVDDVLTLCCEFFDTDKDERFSLHESVLDGKGGRLFLPPNYDDRIMDLVTSRSERTQELLKQAGCNTQDNPRQLEFVFRVRMFRDDFLTEAKVRGGTKSMIFVEVVDSILHGYHKLTNKDYITLAASLVQSCFDCRHVEIVDMIRNKLNKIVPERIILEYNESELISKIESHVSNQSGILTIGKARRLFLDEVQHMPTFGANFFHVEKLTTTKKGHIENEPIIMAISWRGLLLLQIGSHEIIQGITINEFLTYGMKDGKILMVVGTSIRNEKMMFSSWQSDHIDRVIKLTCRQSPAIMALGTNPTIVA